MLIGTGSGATPFASVLQDLRLRLERKDGHSVKVKQLDFYWVIKDQPNGRWMTALLSDFLDDLGKLVGAIRLHVFSHWRPPKEGFAFLLAVAGH